MRDCSTLKTLLKLAFVKWRFRHEPKLVNIYMGKSCDYLPACCNIKDVELDTSNSVHVKSIKVLLRTYDVWFMVTEKSGTVKIFNHQLSPDRTHQAQNLDVRVTIESLIKNLSMWKAEKLYRCEWLYLVKGIAKDYHHDLK